MGSHVGRRGQKSQKMGDVIDGWDASQNDDAKEKIQFDHETLEDTTLRLYNIERDLQNSVQRCMYNMNCTISTLNFKVLFIFLNLCPEI